MYKTMQNVTFFPYLDSARLCAEVAKSGIAFFSEVIQKEEFLDLAKNFGEIFFHRDSDASGITAIMSNETRDVALQRGYLGFTDSELYLHTDRSTEVCPPSKMLLFCQKQSDKGGESLFADGYRVAQILKQEQPYIYELLTSDGAVCYSDGKQTYIGPVFQLVSGDAKPLIRYRTDGCAFISAALAPHWELVKQVIDHCAFSVKLMPNQGVVLDNNRWLHGRTSYSGNREVWRLLVR